MSEQRSGGDSVTLIEELRKDLSLLCDRASAHAIATDIHLMAGINGAYSHALGVCDSLAAVLELRERDRQSGVLAQLIDVMTIVADDPCAVFPSPPPFLAADDTLIWPSNCITQRYERPCPSCLARAALASTKAALPPPENGSGSGSASALEVEAGEQNEMLISALRLIAAGVTTRPLHRVTLANALSCEPGTFLAADIASAALGMIDRPASATKPEASPSPENESAEDGAAIRPRAEADERPTDYERDCNTIRMALGALIDERTVRLANWGDADAALVALDRIIASTTAAEPSPKPESSRPVSTEAKVWICDHCGDEDIRLDGHGCFFDEYDNFRGSAYFASASSVESQTPPPEHEQVEAGKQDAGERQSRSCGDNS